MPNQLPAADVEKIKQYWKEAVEVASDPNTQFLAGGRNFRLGVFAAFKTVFYAAKAVFEVKKAIVLGEIMPWDLIGIAESAYHALTNALKALSEAMSPLEYVGCVVLGSKEEGMTPQELKKELEKFLAADLAERGKRAWYLALTESRLSNAKDELGSTIPFDELFNKLEKKKFVVQSGNKWKFTPRHIDLTFKLEG
jgi:hypothetical protein